jgi:formyltetrahydrofolate hydrolase
MNKRPFNKEAYLKYDLPAKKRLVEIIEKTSDYKLNCNLDIEMYKGGDVKFKKDNKTVLFENEVRKEFDTIVQKYSTIHIPIRKQNTPANFYVVWRRDLNQFILINEKTLNKYRNTIVPVVCNHEDNQDGAYEEDFIDIPKNETQWYVIGKELKLIKLDYD